MCQSIGDDFEAPLSDASGTVDLGVDVDAAELVQEADRQSHLCWRSFRCLGDVGQQLIHRANVKGHAVIAHIEETMETAFSGQVADIPQLHSSRLP